MNYRKIFFFFFLLLESFSGMVAPAHSQWSFVFKRRFTQLTAGTGSNLYGISNIPSHLWFSSDLGQSWSPASNAQDISGFIISPSSGRFYLSSPNGIDTAFDPNCSQTVCWQTLPNHNLLDTTVIDTVVIRADSITALFVRAASDGSKDDELWVGTKNALWYRKLSDTVWIKKDTSVKGTAIEQIVASGKNIYYRTNNDIFASNDGGFSWNKRNQTTFGTITSILALNDTDFYYAVTAPLLCGVFHSTNRGVSFDGGVTFSGRTIQALAVNGFGDVFLGGGIHDATDQNRIVGAFLMKFNHDGQNWQDFSGGLPTISPSAEVLSIGFSAAQVGVVSTDSQGTWVTGRNAVEHSAAQSGITLTQNHPNPANGSTQFSVSSDNPAKAYISVFDALGRNVLQILDGELNSGVTNFTIQTKNLAVGTYFYRLQTSEVTITKTFVVAR